MPLLDEFAALLRAFDPAKSWAEDCLILALILSGILLNSVVARVSRQKVVRQRETWVGIIARSILTELRPAGAIGVNATWFNRRDHLELVVDFSVTSVRYAGTLNIDPAVVAQGIFDHFQSIKPDFDVDDLISDEVGEEPEAQSTSPVDGRTWWSILGLRPEADRGEITVAYRKLAMANHPDLGGNAERMAEINAARDEGLMRSSDR